MADDGPGIDEPGDADDAGGLTKEQREQAQQSIRRVVRDEGIGLSQMAHSAVVSALCASACAPIVAAGLGAGAGVGAAVGVFGGIGAGFLADVVKVQVERLRQQRPDAEIIEDDLVDALRKGFQESLESGSDQAGRLRLDIAEVLARVDGIRFAHEVALEASNEDLARLIERGTDDLGREISKLAHSVGNVGRDVDVSIQLIRMMIVEMRKLAGDLELGQQELKVRSSMDAARRTSRFPRGENPYLGLRAFTTSDSAVFCGRSWATAEVLRRAADQFEAREPLIVVGASGAGKSSLLRAGFLASVSNGAFRVVGSKEAKQRMVRPSYPETGPLENLASGISAITGRTPMEVRTQLNGDPVDFARYVRSRLSSDEDGSAPIRLVLVVDQFEEVFAPDVKVGDRKRFIAALCALASTGRVPIASVVIGLRGDFLDRLTDDAGSLQQALSAPVVVGRITRDEVREMVHVPAYVAGAELEPGLVDVILDDARNAGRSSTGNAYDAGALPLLSESLRRFWEKQQDLEPGKAVRLLTREAYREAGSVAEAVSRTADGVYEKKLDQEQRHVARSLFLHLATISATTVTRRSRDRTSLETRLGPEAGAVIDKFVAARLLVSDKNSVEVAHEVIFDSWAALRSWVEKERALLAGFQSLLDDADRWVQEGRPSHLLVSGPRLSAALRDLSDIWDEGTADAGAADSHADRKEAAREFLRASRRRRTWVRTGIATAAAVVLVTALTAYTSVRDASQAERLQASLKLAEASRDEALTDGPRARLLAAAAWETAETDEARAAMSNSMMSTATGLHVPVTGGGAIPVDPELVAFSGDGSTAASAGADGLVAVWDARTWRTERVFRQKTAVGAIDVSGDGGLVASANVGSLGIIDVLAGEVVDIRTDLAAENVLFSPDDRYVAVSGIPTAAESPDASAVTKVWDIRSEKLLAGSGARSPDGYRLTSHWLHFVSPDSSVVILDSTEGSMPVLRPGNRPGGWEQQGARIVDVAGAARYDLVLCPQPCSDYSVSGAEPATDSVPFKNADGPRSSAPYQAADGGRLVATTYGSGGRFGIEVHDLSRGRLVAVLRTTTPIVDFELSPDGKRVAAAVTGGLQTWSLEGGTASVEISADSPSSVELLDKSTFVVDSADGVQVWDLAVRPPRLVRTDPRISYIGGGKTATRTADRIVIRDVRTGDDISVIPIPEEGINGAGFVGDRFVVDHQSRSSGSSGTTLSMWDPETGALISEFDWEFPDTATGWWGLALEPGGKELLVAHGRSGNLYAFDAETGRKAATLSGATGDIHGFDMAASNGAIYAVTSSGLFKWDSYDSDSKARQLISEPVGSAVASSPRRRYLYLSVNSDIVMWDTKLEAAVASIPMPEELSSLGVSESGKVIAHGMKGAYIVTPPTLRDNLHSTVCERAGRGITQEEASEHMSGLPVDPDEVCGD